MLATAALGTRALATARLGGRAVVPIDKAKPYRLVVTNPNLQVVAVLDQWYGGRWKQEANAPDVLEFSYPLQDAKASTLVFPNKVWLYESSSTIPSQKFHITRRRRAHGYTGEVLTIFAKDYSSQLAKEWIVEETSGAAVTVKSLVASWLAGQLAEHPIRLGTIHPSIGNETVSISIAIKSVLNAIHELQAMVGGWFWVDAASERFYWDRWRGERKGQQIRVQKNMTEMSVDEDYEQIVTRVYPKGQGTVPRHKVGIAAPGYLEKNTGTYGIIPFVISDPSIAESDRLADVAQSFLDRNSVPKKTYSVGVIDLSQADLPVDFSFEKIQLGSLVRIINEQLGEEFESNILSIERNLDAPMQMQAGQGALSGSGLQSWGSGSLGPDGGFPDGFGGIGGGGSGGGGGGGGGDFDLPQDALPGTPPTKPPSGGLDEGDVLLHLADPDSGTAEWGGNAPDPIADLIEQLVELRERVEAADNEDRGVIRDIDLTTHEDGTELPVVQRIFDEGLVGDTDDLPGSEGYEDLDYRPGDNRFIREPSPGHPEFRGTDEGWHEYGSDIELSDEEPLQHGPAADTGTGELAARDDHVHPGRAYYEATDKSALAITDIPEAAEAWTTSSKLSFDWNSTAEKWVLRSGQRIADEAALSITGLAAEDDGATLYAESEDTYHLRYKGSWVQLIRCHVVASGGLPNVAAPALGFVSGTGKYSVRSADLGWLLISHWA